MNAKYISCYLFILICLISHTPVKAQTVRLPYDPTPAKIPEYKTLDTAIVRVKYRMLAVNDTSDLGNKKENLMILQIGSKMSRYADYYKIISDSLKYALAVKKEAESVVNEKVINFMAGTLPINVFKHPDKEKIVTIDRVPFNTYMYEEELEAPEWRLEFDTSEVCGYVCQKATATFFGRNYTAWYAPEIAINEGPWKFIGLPGLILKVEDDRGHYSFECVAIETPKPNDWTLLIYDPGSTIIRIKKEQFFKQQKQFYDNPAGAVEGSGMLQSEIPERARRSRPYNPIELTK